MASLKYLLDSDVYKILDVDEKSALKMMDLRVASKIIWILRNLKGDGIVSLVQLAGVTDDLILSVNGIGPMNLGDIKKALVPWKGMPYEVVVPVRMLESQRDQIYAKAKKLGLTPSLYVNSILFGDGHGVA